MIGYGWWIDDTVLTNNLDWHDITDYDYYWLMPTADTTEPQSESLEKLLYQICRICPSSCGKKALSPHLGQQPCRSLPVQ